MHLKLTTLLLPLLLSATSATSSGPPPDPQTTHHIHLHAHPRRHPHAPRRFPVFLAKPDWGAALSTGGTAGAALAPSGNTSSTTPTQSPNCTCVQTGATYTTTPSGLSNHTTSRPPSRPPNCRAPPLPQPYAPHPTPPKPFPDMPAHQPADFWAHATPVAATEPKPAPARRRPHAPRRFPVFLATPDWGAAAAAAALSTASSATGVAGSHAASGNAAPSPRAPRTALRDV